MRAWHGVRAQTCHQRQIRGQMLVGHKPAETCAVRLAAQCLQPREGITVGHVHRVQCHIAQGRAESRKRRDLSGR